MSVHKLSISVPLIQFQFIENYQTEHHYKTRSEVIRDAIYLLQQKQLETAYQEANHEIDPSWNAVVADGLDENETW